MDNVFIIIACYNDGIAINRLLLEIEQVVKGRGEKFHVVVIDDGSDDHTRSALGEFKFKESAVAYHLLRLEYNLGHQAAIGQGILYAHDRKADYAIVMDGDGEDDPEAIRKLLDLKNFDIVHVLRGKRMNKGSFMYAYAIYKFIFRLITFKRMNFGNYSMINKKVIGILSTRSFIHLAAFLSKLRLNSTSVMFDRRLRHEGKSKMTVSDLIHHGFRSFVEYAEEMLMVFLRLFVILFVLLILTTGYIIFLKIFTDRAILGWTSTLGIGLLTSALLCIGFFLMGVLLLNLNHRRSFQRPVASYRIIHSGDLL